MKIGVTAIIDQNFKGTVIELCSPRDFEGLVEKHKFLQVIITTI